MVNPQGKAYLTALFDTYFKFDYQSERVGNGVNDGGYREKLNYHINIPYPTREPVIIGHSRDKVVKDYTEKEMILFDEGNIYDLHYLKILVKN